MVICRSSSPNYHGGAFGIGDHNGPRVPIDNPLVISNVGPGTFGTSATGALIVGGINGTKRTISAKCPAGCWM